MNSLLSEKNENNPLCLTNSTFAFITSLLSNLSLTDFSFNSSSSSGISEEEFSPEDSLFVPSLSFSNIITSSYLTALKPGTITATFDLHLVFLFLLSLSELSYITSNVSSA